MTLEFRGGRAAAALPLVFFIIWAIAICVGGVPDENGLILGIVLGLIVGMFLCRSCWSHYAQCVVEGMADCIATVTIVAWFWAGMFAAVLREGGLVNGLVWLGHVSNAEGGVFVGVTFLLAATFSTAVGTGYGTTVAFTTLMYPTGLVMGADPVWLFGAILSGAALGDNLAPVSDTTVVSATTQETDIPGVVRSRFRYAAVAAVPALVCFTLFGGGGAAIESPRSTLVDAASPHGLIFLIPFAFVIFLALRGYAILVTLTWGIVVAIALGLACGLLTPSQLVSFDAERDVVGGALVDGISGYLSMAILILLIVAGGRVMRAGGAMDALVNGLGSLARNSVARAEMVIWSVVFSLNVFITINTAAEITAAPFVSRLGRRFHLHPYRRANMLDAVTSALGYIFPWGGGVLIGYQTIQNLAPRYEFFKVVSPTEVWPFVLHGWFLALVMLMAAITGFGRMFEAADGSPTREPPRDQ
ncbi:MAG: Na+/H+ antiporter NhaC family protein [Planctomycetota bacterium]